MDLVHTKLSVKLMLVHVIYEKKKGHCVRKIDTSVVTDCKW